MKNAVAGGGLAPDAAMVTFPINMFLPGSDINPLKERRREIFVPSAVELTAGCGRGDDEQGQEHQWEQGKSRNPVTETFAHHRLPP